MIQTPCKEHEYINVEITTSNSYKSHFRQCANCGQKESYLPVIKQESETPVMQGWECPRCFTIHSPFKQNCDCPPKTFASSTMSFINF